MTNSTLTLRSFDIPAIHRFGVGFDSMLDDLSRLAASNSNNYPPYNLIKTDDNKFSIEVAVAGFSEGEISITMEKNHLTIKGAKNIINLFILETFIDSSVVLFLFSSTNFFLLLIFPILF